MDEQIAKTIFGWTCVHRVRTFTREEVIAQERRRFLEDHGVEAPPTYGGDVYWILEHSDYPPKKCDLCGLTDKDPSLHRRLPKFSTDIAAAWQVVEALKARNIHVVVVTTPEYSWCNAIFGEIEAKGVAKPDEVPKAICEAALQIHEKLSKTGCFFCGADLGEDCEAWCESGKDDP